LSVRNIKLLLEYDGTDFIGWQRQAQGRSVQGEIEEALQKLIREKANVIGAGRTDSGVHARGQVANYKCDTTMTTEQMKKGLTALLDDDISILAVDDAAEEFHARFSAKSRLYSFLVCTYPSALRRKYSWFVKYELDFNLLNKCAEKFLGLHDFKIFSKDDAGVKNFYCDVMESFWTIENNSYRYKILANRFLHTMVRLLVGTMVDIARGYVSFEELEKAFLDGANSNKNKIDRRLGQAAPAQGLVLESIQY
jgi:tRNA pseudouridine38-40 synthase